MGTVQVAFGGTTSHVTGRRPEQEVTEVYSAHAQPFPVFFFLTIVVVQNVIQ